MRCKALKPTSDSRLQDFLGTLQSFEAYLRFQPSAEIEMSQRTSIIIRFYIAILLSIPAQGKG
jgi:hypothetical protein